jgi:hypothetical protein
MSASQQARNKALAITLDNERHEFTKREMALCKEIERLRDLCAEWLLFCEDAAGYDWLDGLRNRTCTAIAAGRGEGLVAKCGRAKG